MIKVIHLLVLSCLIACNAVPINPETNQPLVEDAEELSHEEKVGLQQDIIDNQEKQKTRQEREYLELQRQEYYNHLQRRFEDQ